MPNDNTHTGIDWNRVLAPSESFATIRLACQLNGTDFASLCETAAQIALSRTLAPTNDNTHAQRELTIQEVFRVANEIRAEGVSDTLHLEEMESRLFDLSRTPAEPNADHQPDHLTANYLRSRIVAGRESLAAINHCKTDPSSRWIPESHVNECVDSVIANGFTSNATVRRVLDAEPKAGDWEKTIRGALKQSIDAHGPIDLSNHGSAAKRISGQLRALSSAAPRITEKVLPCPDCHGTGTRGDYANAPNCETCDGGGVLYAPALSPTEVRSCGCVDVAIQEYGNQVELPTPMHVMLATGKGATVCIDACIASEIQALWRQGIRTTGCCCGHGTHSPYIGVVFEDIPRMKELGYKVAPNPSRPGDEDSFYPRSIHCTMSPAPLSGITEEMVEQVVSEFADPIKGSFDRTGYDDGAEYAALEIKDRLIALFRQQGAERKWISVDGQEIMPGTVLLVESWLNEWRVDVVKWGERTQWSKGDRRYSVLFESMPTPPPFTPTSHQVTSEATQAEG